MSLRALYAKQPPVHRDFIMNDNFWFRRLLTALAHGASVVTPRKAGSSSQRHEKES